MEEEFFEAIGKSLGFKSLDDFATAIAMEGVKKTTLELQVLVKFVKENNIFTDEGCARLEQIVVQYLNDLAVIIETEQAIQALREQD